MLSRVTGWMGAAGALIAALANGGEPVVLDSGLRPGEVSQRPYRDYARECIDLLIEHGTDRYGTGRSPILMNILDVRTRDCPADPLPLDQAWRVIRRGRRGPGGANLYMDMPTYRAMRLLGQISGRERYASFVDRSLGHYLDHLVDDRGPLWWGWHRHYDAHRDVRAGHSGNHHEIHIQQVVWPLLWDANGEATACEIQAVWTWHVCNKQTGEVNRHADGRRGCDFAMSGGEILQAFAFLYARTGDQKWLDRARLLAEYYWKARHRETCLIPNRPNAGAGRFDGSHFDTSITAFHCRALLKASELTGDARFRRYAVAYLKAYARLGYDRSARRFWGSLALDGTPVRGPRVVGGYRQYEPRGHIDLWQPYIAGYEHPLATAQVYAYAYALTQEAALLEAARRWAACIRDAFPAEGCEEHSWYGDYARHWAPHGTYAEHYGRTLSFFLQLHALTGEADDLAFARQVADEAVAKLYYRGLLRGHPAKPYYEAADGVGFLLVALLQLDQALAGKATDPSDFENW
ncbi:MAG: hypothetical protein ACODAJ_13900 [Planctomycetota bacterium]